MVYMYIVHTLIYCIFVLINVLVNLLKINLTVNTCIHRWVKKFGENKGLDVLLNILRACVGNSFSGKDVLLRRIQHQCVRSIRAFMNNKVHLWSRMG